MKPHELRVLKYCLLVLAWLAISLQIVSCGVKGSRDYRIVEPQQPTAERKYIFRIGFVLNDELGGTNSHGVRQFIDAEVKKRGYCLRGYAIAGNPTIVGNETWYAIRCNAEVRNEK